MPIRVRIALLGAGIVALALVVFSVGIGWLAAVSAPGEQDRDLSRRGGEIQTRVRMAAAEDFTPRPALAATDLANHVDIFVMVLGADGALLSSTGAIRGVAPVIPAELLTAAEAKGKAYGTITAPLGVELRVLVQPWSRDDLGLRGYTVAGQPTRHRSEQAAGLRAFFILVGIVVLLVALGAIWVALGRALRPLKVVANTAGDIARTGDLGRRLPPVRTRDEVRLLTDSFNGMLDRLQETYHRLGHALESQKRFVADASHELRTPLTTIRTNAGFLMQHPDGSTEDRDAALQDIAGESERMGRLVHDLLTLARADAGHHLVMTRLDLAASVLDVCRQARTLHPGRCIDVEDDGPAPVEGNEDALKQLLWILVDNAVKHTPEEGHIRLWAGARAGRALAQVSDDGPGIPTDDLGRIFERFYQADRARAGEGAGLGLAIARWIVAEHGGEIIAYNNHGGGATFRVELPLASV
jgi:two-component system, OmpR family, sensor kinase